MTATPSYDGLVFSEDNGKTEVSFAFTHGALYVAIKNAFEDEVEEAICEADARTLLAYLKEKLGE